MESWVVYEHIFPNGKSYIGITNNVLARWRNGRGYERQKKIWNAIKKYGWDNIEHKILFDGLTHEEAKEKEVELIRERDSITNGYNIQQGGGSGRKTFLSSYMMAMCRCARRYNFFPIHFSDGISIPVMEFVYNLRYDKDAAETIALYETAIKEAYGELPVSFDGAMEFAFQMCKLLAIEAALHNGDEMPDYISMGVNEYISHKIFKEVADGKHQ